METTIKGLVIYGDYLGIMAKKMETTPTYYPVSRLNSSRALLRPNLESIQVGQQGGTK